MGDSSYFKERNKRLGYTKKEKEAKDWYRRTYGKIDHKWTTNSKIVRK